MAPSNTPPDKPRKTFSSLAIETRTGDYSLHFLPGVVLEDRDGAYDRWLSFVETIAAKTRLGEEPGTGAIGLLYRDRVWLGDLMLADDVRSLNVIPDIARVEGDLIARGARVINKHFTNQVEVMGGLGVPAGLLRRAPAPITFHGPLMLYGLKYPEELVHGPERLMQWGARPGGRVHVGGEIYDLVQESGASGAVFLLRGREGAGAYVWEQEQWQHLAKSSVSEALLNDINGRLIRFCTLIGVGAGYAVNHPRKVGYNIRKISGYLRLLKRECRARCAGEGDTGDETAIGGVLHILQNLERTVYGVAPDEANIRIMLDLLGDRAFSAVASANDVPRKAADEQRVKGDIDYLRGLEEEDLNLDVVLPSGTRTLLLLTRILRSKGAQRGLLQTMELLKTNFDAVAGHTGLARRVRFLHLLSRPGLVFTALRNKTGGAPAQVAAALKALESEFKALESTPPTRVIRELSGNPLFACAPDTQDEKRLLSTLYAFKGELDDLQPGGTVFLEILRTSLLSSISADLAEALKVLRGREEQTGVAAQVVAHSYKRSSPTEFVRFLLRRLEWDHSVLKAFNAVTLRLRRMESVEEEQTRHRDEIAAPREDIPPDLKAYVHMKLNRVCLRLNLGKGFLEQLPDSYHKNMEKLLYFLVVSYENAQLGDETLTERARQVISDLANRIEAIGEGLSTARYGQVHEMLGDLDDKYLRLVDSVLQKARSRIDAGALGRDIAALKRFSGEALTLEYLFATPERLLNYLNGVLESEDMKRAVYRLVKPVNLHFRELQQAGRVPKDITITDLLRDFDTVVAHLGDPAADAMVGGLLEAMAALRQRTLHEVLNILTHSKLRAPSEQTGRDREFLATLAGFESGALPDLRLNASQLGRLLMMHLDSFARQDLQAMHDNGTLDRLPPLDAVNRLLAKMRWYDSVISTYNSLA